MRCTKVPPAPIPFCIYAMFQLKFAVITPALSVSGYIERIRFAPFIVYARARRLGTTGRGSNHHLQEHIEQSSEISKWVMDLKKRGDTHIAPVD